jgi:hypothetical protein
VRELFLGGFSGEILVVAFDVGELEAIELRANRHEDARILSVAAVRGCSGICVLVDVCTRRMTPFPQHFKINTEIPNRPTVFGKRIGDMLLSKHAIAPIAETQPRCPLLSSFGMRDCGPLLRALRIADGRDYLASGCSGLC